MKNMFGLVSRDEIRMAQKYSPLGGIQQSILDICGAVPVHFVIVDGIIAMEGNGPLNGAPRHLAKIVLSNDPVAAMPLAHD